MGLDDTESFDRVRVSDNGSALLKIPDKVTHVFLGSRNVEPHDRLKQDGAAGGESLPKGLIYRNAEGLLVRTLKLNFCFM